MTKKNMKLDDIFGVSPYGDVKTQLGYKVARELPHGSGIDGTWHIEEKDDKIVASNSYHKMDEHGFYVGWQDFTVEIPKDNPQRLEILVDKDDFESDWEIQNFKEYLQQTFIPTLENIEGWLERKSDKKLDEVV